MPASALRRPARTVAAATLVAAALTGCGAQANPQTLLAQAKQAIDSAQSAHFELSGGAAAGSGPFITGGSGDIKRPASFTGSLTVDYSGLQVSVQAVSAGGHFYVHLPTSSGFQQANPGDYGFADPGQLMDPTHGLSSLLTQCQSPGLQGDDRLSGEQLHEVGCSIPGTLVASLLTDAQPGKPVAATFGISVDSGQLRRVVLTGPFYNAQNNTFTLVLDKYGENVTITAPPGQ